MENNTTKVHTDESRKADSSYLFQTHPSRNLAPRRTGFGIGGGYEKPRKQGREVKLVRTEQIYGSVPHQGYYGSTGEDIRFKEGDAGYKEESLWFNGQFCGETSGYKESD